MEREEYDKLRARDKEEQKKCLAGLNEKDQITALLIVVNIQGRELGGLSRLTIKEHLETCCDERKNGNTKGILSAVKKVLEIHKNRS